MDDWTVAQAQEWLRDRLSDGAKCPCCTQQARVYSRSITAPMAAGLIVWWKKLGMDDGHVSMVKDQTHEFSQLSWWKLITEIGERRDDGGRAGWWHITDLGADFVTNRIKIPKYAYVYDSKVQRLDASETVAITECLGVKFDYNELMGRSPGDGEDWTMF